MELLLLFGVLALGWAASGDGSDELDVSEDQPDQSAPPDEVEQVASSNSIGTDEVNAGTQPADQDLAGYYIVADELNTGTQSADLFTHRPDSDEFIQTSVHGGAGDDLFLLNITDQMHVHDSEILGQAGDDAIYAMGDSTTISGGDGNDTIVGSYYDSTIFGDAGDDFLDVEGWVNASGGLGNDTIDTRGADNVLASGDEGNDHILSDGFASGGAGYVKISDGGAGDDRLTHEVDYFPINLSFVSEEGIAHIGEPVTLRGGEGADIFEIELHSRGGRFAASEDDPELLRVSAAVIEDFEPGVDKVEVDLERLTIGYNAAAARLIEDSTAGSTTLVITLTDDDAENHLPTQEIVVDVRATGLTWDDVDFVANEETPIVLAQLAT